MTKKQVIKITEKFVKKTFEGINDYAHDYLHVDRVRKWAMKIGKEEKGVDLFLLEVAALLHDIGRVKETKKISHYAAGELMAKEFLKSLGYFPENEVEMISRAVRLHGAGGNEKLIMILRDADMLDLWGAISIGRAFSFFHDKPYYLGKKSFRQQGWSDKKIKKYIKSRPWEASVIDNLNFCLDVYTNISTQTAKKMARKKIDYLKKFIRQFEEETVNL